MRHLKTYILAGMIIAAALLGCGAKQSGDAGQTSAAETAAIETSAATVQEGETAQPEPDDIIVSFDDIEVPYNIYRHYYNAMAMKLSSESDAQWDEERLEKLKQYTEELLLEDCVYRMVAASQDIELSDEEQASVRETAKEQAGTSEELEELTRFRLESEALKDKAFTTLYTSDYLKSAVHVSCLYIPYADTTKEEADSKNQLASLISSLGNSQTKTLKELADSVADTSGAVMQDMYLTSGDMGQGTYDLAASLDIGEVSGAFTLGDDGVYVMQRLENDEDYIQENIKELLENSTQFTGLYRMLTYAAKESADIRYTEDFDRIPAPSLYR